MPNARQRSSASIALLTVAILALSIVAGCDVMTAQSTPRPSRLIATPEPRPEETAAQTDEAPTLRPDPSSDSLGLIDAASALADLDSYRVSITSRGLVPASEPGGTVTMTSTLIQGEESAAEFRIVGLDGLESPRLDAVLIGEEAWLKTDAGPWRKSPGGAAEFDAAFTTLSPIDLVTQFDALAASFRAIGATERRNGVRVRHLHTDSDAAAARAAGLSAGAADVWLAEPGGRLVALEVAGTWDLDGTATPVELRIDVTHVNDPSNRVTPPAR